MDHAVTGPRSMLYTHCRHCRQCLGIYAAYTVFHTYTHKDSKCCVFSCPYTPPFKLVCYTHAYMYTCIIHVCITYMYNVHGIHVPCMHASTLYVHVHCAMYTCIICITYMYITCTMYMYMYVYMYHACMHLHVHCTIPVKGCRRRPGVEVSPEWSGEREWSYSHS